MAYDQAAARKDDYWERRRLRLCARCKADMDRDGAYCSKCSVGHGTTADRRDWQRQKLAAGKCLYCGKRDRELRADGTLTQTCGVCAARVRATKAARYRKLNPTVKAVQLCGLCRQPGHKRTSCSRGQFRLDVVAYATSRETRE